MFAQMMKFQMESQQKNEEKLLQLQKENEERILKNEEKQRRFFIELQKQQEALFKSLSNNQPTDSTTIFTQNAAWNARETFSYAPDEDKTFEEYYGRYEDIYIIDCTDWTDAKIVRLLLRKLGAVKYNKFVDYILQKNKKTKKNLRTWLFRNS